MAKKPFKMGPEFPTRMSTPVRSTAIPKVSPPKEVTYEMIAQRAYEIWQTSGGSDLDNWLRAERELKGEQF